MPPRGEDTSKNRILIADDTPANIKVLGEALRSQYKINVATNGEDAIKIAMSDTPPDLILLDVMMPGLDGYEVCAQLQGDNRTKNIPIIFITAKSQEQDETKGLELGAVDYISKPVSLPILKARVHTHLELKRHRDTLEMLSMLDGLTGVSNRRVYDNAVDVEWRRSLRSGKPVTLIMIDIDHFKQYNDSQGHQAGDDCLKRVAATLAAQVRRPGDLLARYGGEEFVSLLPDTDVKGAEVVSELMRKSVEDLQIPHAHSHYGVVTVSIGVACVCPHEPLESFDLVKTADSALYESKEKSRNRVTLVEMP